ncbi:MAG TPA: 30S ribosomal protein S1 [Thermomicrobiales bacterium]|nr:30S ribosomal protein S1 [Thermomicrobiales bacterium]
MDGTDVREQGGVNGDMQETQVDSQSAAGTDYEQELDGASLMEQFLSDPDHDYKTLKYGDVLEGIVMHKDRDELLVDIGSKAEGIVPAKEYSSLTDEEKENLAVGDTVLVFVVQPENQEGHPVVSIDRARQEKSWRQLQERHEANDVIEAEVTNYNKGGLLVNLDGVRGFVPASQVTEIRGGDEASKQADMARLIGTSLALKVIEINRHRNRLILSERQAVQERRDAMKEQLIKELTEGEVRTGTVSSLCDFGAFVDIGGADGLVHLSELSWSRVRHPSEVLNIGEEVQVYVLGINAEEKKIALSIKRTQPEPWSRVATSYEVGQLVKGTVTQLANFGAFARIEDGIEGLIHVSELAEERIQHPKQVVEEGEELILRIIRIDPQRRRMGLSLRRALETPDSELASVFGDDILAERDNLARKVRSRLEAEGLVGQAPQPTPEQAAAASPEALEDLDEEAAKRAAGEAQVAAFEERRRRAEEAEQARQRRQEERRQQRGASSGEFAGGDMSAMAMAFAQAGASDLNDLISGEEQEAGESKSGQSPSAAADSAGENAQPAQVAGAAGEAREDTNAEGDAALADETTAQRLAGDEQIENPVSEDEKITDAGSEWDKTIVEKGSADEGDVVPNPETEETENPQPGEQPKGQE